MQCGLYSKANSIIFAARKYGGCSSVWLERQIVALKAGGSSPLILPRTLHQQGFFITVIFDERLLM